MNKNNLNNFVYNVREISSIRELCDGSCENFSGNTAFVFREGDGVREVTYGEVYDNIKAFASYLRSLGLEGKKIAVLGKNCYEWALTYLTVCAGVGIIVPLDKDLSAEDIKYLVKDSETAAIVFAPEQAEKLDGIDDDVIKLSSADMPLYIAEGKKLRDEGDRAYEQHKINPYSLGILIYTSGTTGVSKGVMLSQYNICSNIVHVARRTAVYPYDRTLSVLPLHHTYECMAGFLSFFYSGASIAYNNSLRQLQADFVLFKPTVFVAVPVLLEKLYSMIVKKYAKMKGGKAVLAVQRSLSKLVGKASSQRKVFATVNASLGGKLNRILCGAAALSPEAYHGYESFGYRVYVGYGLTETSPVCIMHHDGYTSADDIGYPLVGVSVKIVEPNADGVGELAIKGPNVMLGYYKNPEATAQVIRDGWFYTGDLAKRLENGAYKIMGRIKSMIVLENGKKVFPEEIEYYLDSNKYVAESFVFGKEENGVTTVTASIIPDNDAIDEELSKSGDKMTDEERENRIKAIIYSAVAGVNSHFAAYKAVKKIIIRKSDFIKTTTHKIKRLEEKNKEEE